MEEKGFWIEIDGKFESNPQTKQIRLLPGTRIDTIKYDHKTKKLEIVFE